MSSLNPAGEGADERLMEAAPSPWRRLGRLLVEEGLLTEDQLDVALGHQVRTRRLLGDIVVELGYVSPDEVERVLALQAGLPAEEGSTFGSGLRSELERRQADSPPPPPSPQLPAGYALVDRAGAAPEPGSVIELPDRGTFRVETVGLSPYPDDPRRCAFALRVHDLPI